MKSVHILGGVIALVIVTLVVALIALWQYPQDSRGSVLPGGEYIATTTSTMTAGVHQVVAGNRVLTLGSIIVASSSAATLEIRDATSTTDTASTTVVTLQATPDEGTYTFDISLKRGLVVVPATGFNGDYVITFRSQ